MNKYLCYLLPLLVGISSCTKEEYDFQNIGLNSWKPTLAVPLVSSRLGVDKILATNNIEALNIDADGFITLNYRSEPIQFSTGTLVELPNFNETIILDNFTPIDIPVIQDTTLRVNVSVTESIDAGGTAVLQKILLKSGLLKLGASSNLSQDVRIGLSIPNIKDQFSQSVDIQLNVNQTNPNDQEQVNLNSGEFEFLSNQGPNEFEISFELEIEYKTGDFIRTSDAISIDIGIENMEFSRIFGDFGQQTIDLPRDSILVALFQNTFTEGNFRLAAPKLYLEIENGLGLGLELEFTDIFTYNASTSKITPLNLSSLSNNNFPLNPATIQNQSNDPRGPITKPISVIAIDDQGISDIITPTPKYIVQQLKATLNPGAGPYNNFITDDASIGLISEIEMPLEGSISRFDLRDTVAFNLGENISELDRITIVIDMENGFPINGVLQLYLLDEFNVVLDSLLKGSLLERTIIPTGKANDNGRVVQSTGKTSNKVEIVLDLSSASALLKAKKISIEANLTTDDFANKLVKIYNDYELNVKLATKIEASLNFSEEEQR